VLLQNGKPRLKLDAPEGPDREGVEVEDSLPVKKCLKPKPNKMLKVLSPSLVSSH